MLQIILKNSQYRAFIKYSISNCDSFSVVFEKDDIDKSKYIFQEFYSSISEFIIDKKSIGNHPDTGTSFQNSDINYYKCNNYIRTILQLADSIFDWNGENLPEELCFYRNAQKWFTCVCHEKYLFIYNETKDDVKFLEKEKIKYLYEIGKLSDNYA